MSGFNSISLIKSLLNMVRTEIVPNKGDDMSEMNVRMWTLCLLCLWLTQDYAEALGQRYYCLITS